MKSFRFATILATAQPIKACRKLFVLALGLTALLVCTGPLRAGVLYVPNYSFESQPTPFADPRVDAWQKAAQPDTFDTNVFGAWTNLIGVFSNTPAGDFDHIDNADGTQLAYLFAYPQMAIFQDYNSTDWSNGPSTHAFNAVFQPGKSYQLTVGLTTSSDEPLTPGSTLEVSLYYRDSSNNMVTVAATNVMYDTNTFADPTHLVDFYVDVPAVQTNDPWAGQNIGIQFESTVYDPDLLGGLWDLDNVRLTENIPVPNFSFESQPTPFADPRVDSWQKAEQPDTFDTNVFGAWDNLTGVFSNTPAGDSDHIDNADGTQLAYLFAYPQMALFQDYNSTDWSNGLPTHAFNAVFQPGKSYQLTVGLTTSSDEPLTPGSSIEVSLYYRDGSNNMVTVAATNVTYDTNTFADPTHLIDFQTIVPKVNAGDPWAGQNIGIQFACTVYDPDLIGGVWDLDNVRLSELVLTTLNAPSQTNGQFNFTLQSEPKLAFEILATTNITQPATNWMSIVTLTNATGNFLFTDPATNLNQRFYRAHQL